MFASTWITLAVVFFIYSVILSLGAEITYGIATLILGGPLFYGTARICVKLVCGNRKINIEDLMIGFKCFTDSLVLYLMTALYTFLWSLLFVIPGIVKSYSYSLAPYILQDNPNKGWQKSLDESKRMMEGHKMDLFVLDLSFIGWYIVGLMALGVGVFLVVPYHYMARANFYMALKAQRENEGNFGYNANMGGNTNSGSGFGAGNGVASDGFADGFKVEEHNVDEKKSDETSKSDVKRKINLDK